jgi:cytoskeletal protein CcmA (bactofilin family)
VLEGQKPESESDAAQTPRDESPRLDLSVAALRRDGLRPPIRPFSAKTKFKTQLFRSTLAKGRSMSDRFSSDRMAAFTPQIPRRVADIPNPASMRAAEADNDGKRLVIGRQITMSGEISGCERLVVEGKVDAKLNEVKSLEVTANGSFKGSADVESAIVAGTYDGTLKVRGHLEIAGTGIVKGAVSYKTIAVANGGKVQGSIETIDA